MNNTVTIRKGTIQETLLAPLWGRAFEMQRENPRLIDEKAAEVIQCIDYDFSEIEKNQSKSPHGWVARSLHTNRGVQQFMAAHPNATVVNIGRGLDTTFTRIDNGQIMFYELDLPDVIELRENVYEDGERHVSIASSFLQAEWFNKIQVRDGLLFLAGGCAVVFSRRANQKVLC